VKGKIREKITETEVWRGALINVWAEDGEKLGV
jgi:hypothetical protein